MQAEPGVFLEAITVAQSNLNLIENPDLPALTTTTSIILHRGLIQSYFVSGTAHLFMLVRKMPLRSFFFEKSDDTGGVWIKSGQYVTDGIC